MVCAAIDIFFFYVAYTFHGIAENLGWVKDEKNAEIRAKFKKAFDWFDEVGEKEGVTTKDIIPQINKSSSSIDRYLKILKEYRFNRI